MKASELRIGNKLLKDGIVVTIDGRSIFDIWSSQLTHSNLAHPYEPIPLTEEWLIKFGFRKVDDEFVLSFNGLQLTQTTFMGLWLLTDEDDEEVRLPFEFELIQYVHQLQNLYFGLTGEELNIDLNTDEKPNKTPSRGV